MEKRKYYIITKFPEGANALNTKESLVTTLEVSTEDEEFDTDDFETFEEYVDYCIEEECGDAEQHWGTCVVLTEEEFKIVKSFKE